MPLQRRREQTPKVIPDVAAPKEKPAQIEEAPPPIVVSAVILSFNRAAALRRAIEALEKSTDRERLEILVIDLGSSDESPTLDAEYGGVTMLRLPRYIGATKAMNIATRTAKGEFVFFLVPEVEVSPQTAAALAARIQAESDTIAVCPFLVDPDGKSVPRTFRIPMGAALKAVARGDDPQRMPIDETQESVPVEYASHDALMVRRQFIQGMNYFDARYGEFGGDLDLAMQVRSAGRKIRLYPAIRATYHSMADPVAGDPLFIADRAHGAAVFLAKYQGFFSGLMFRIGAILRALVGFKLNQVAALASWSKIDGNQ